MVLGRGEGNSNKGYGQECVRKMVVGSMAKGMVGAKVGDWCM